ncbi:unnamed protein product [Bathycoccus prasinos]
MSLPSSSSSYSCESGVTMVFVTEVHVLSSGTWSSPFAYDQPSGRGQSLSRRYCTHSVWFSSCATRTASSSHGALAVSCKYFKQSKWPYSAAHRHARSLYLSYLRSTRYSSMWR